MTMSPSKSPEYTLKMNAEIKKAFPKLSDEEIAFQASSPDKFYDAVKTKQGIAKDEAEKTVKKLDAECGASSTAAKSADNSTDKAAAPVSKAS